MITDVMGRDDDDGRVVAMLDPERMTGNELVNALIEGLAEKTRRDDSS